MLSTSCGHSSALLQDRSLPAVYTVVRQSFVSTGLSEGSSLVGCVKPGEFITVLEKRLMSNHHERVRATRLHPHKGYSAVTDYSNENSSAVLIPTGLGSAWAGAVRRRLAEHAGSQRHAPSQGRKVAHVVWRRRSLGSQSIGVDADPRRPIGGTSPAAPPSPSTTRCGGRLISDRGGRHSPRSNSVCVRVRTNRFILHTTAVTEQHSPPISATRLCFS